MLRFPPHHTKSTCTRLCRTGLRYGMSSIPASSLKVANAVHIVSSPSKHHHRRHVIQPPWCSCHLRRCLHHRHGHLCCRCCHLHCCCCCLHCCHCCDGR